MLWYKAWLETRARFLIALLGILCLCSYSVLHGELQAEHWVNRSYYNYVLSEGCALLAVMWVLAVTLLMMGGLVREHALGSASFTLGLPVSRRRLMAVRIGMGALQASTIALIPTGAMYLIARIWGGAFFISQIWFHLVLLLTGGAVFFAIALLASSIVGGEYTAPIVAFGVLMVISATLGNNTMRPFSPLAFTIGTEYFDTNSNLLVGPIPWLKAVEWLCLAAFLAWIALRFTEQRDF